MLPRVILSCCLISRVKKSEMHDFFKNKPPLGLYDHRIGELLLTRKVTLSSSGESQGSPSFLGSLFLLCSANRPNKLKWRQRPDLQVIQTHIYDISRPPPTPIRAYFLLHLQPTNLIIPEPNKIRVEGSGTEHRRGLISL
jgi:hypothetical protein